METLAGFVIVGGIISILVVIAFVKGNLKVCPPNEILIFSGKKRRLPDGTVVGYRILKGGRGFRIPIIESVRSMSLETIPIHLEVRNALTKGLIPVHVEAMANVKIAGEEKQGLFNAVERFLGKPREDISRIASETLEGSLRGVVAAMSAEEANSERLRFAQLVVEQATSDFQRLGLVLDTFKIQDISDEQGYLVAIGRKKNAEVQRDARIAEAQSEAEARKVAAAARREGNVAEAEAEQKTIEAQNALHVKAAELAAIRNRAESKAALAGSIARAEEEKVLETVRVDLNKKKYEADVIIPAQAGKQARELQAVGEAATIVENGKATAEAVRRMREEWESGNTRELFLIQLLPDIIDKITKVVANNLSIERLTIVDSGNGTGGIPNYVGSLTGSVVAVLEQIKNATGLDVPEILQTRTKPVRNALGIPPEYKETVAR